MAIWRSPELEAVFGGPLDSTGVSLASVQLLVAEETPESDVLDFKRMLWAKSSRPRRAWTEEQEFAKDVGAFANHRGGVLLVGVDETSGLAAGEAPFALVTNPESEERRLRQALVNNLAPLAACEFVWIPTTTGDWFCAVIVPRSSRAPHAVVTANGTGLRYPARHGPDTIWLPEADVAERYRRRHVAQADEAARTERVVSDGTKALPLAPAVWLYAAAVPELSVAGGLDSASVRRIEEWNRNNVLTSPLGRDLPAFGRGIPAPGMVTFTGSRVTGDADETEVRDAYVELHVDGSAFAATPVALNTTDKGTGLEIGELTVVDDGILVIDRVLQWCSHQAGAWGTATVVLGLADNDVGSLPSPLQLVVADGPRVIRRKGTRSPTDRVRTSTVADLANTGTLQQRLSVAHAALSGLLQWFGIAEPRQIKPDGTIVPSEFTMSHYRRVEKWATNHDVPAERLPNQ